MPADVNKWTECKTISSLQWLFLALQQIKTKFADVSKLTKSCICGTIFNARQAVINGGMACIKNSMIMKCTFTHLTVAA